MSQKLAEIYDVRGNLPDRLRRIVDRFARHLAETPPRGRLL